MAKPYAIRKALFDEWHKNNPMIWQYFEKFAMEAIRMRRTKISHWLIINRIRWEVYVITTGDDFKISNDFIAFYARLWREKYPQHKDLFNIKRMDGEPWQPELI
jgi:hypothetical protein